jgi:hypothetical protein
MVGNEGIHPCSPTRQAGMRGKALLHTSFFFSFLIFLSLPLDGTVSEYRRGTVKRQGRWKRRDASFSGLSRGDDVRSLTLPSS